MQVWIGLMLVVGLLSACDSPETSKTVLDDQVKALKKAEAVGDKVEKHNKTMQQGVDAATDSPATDR